MMNVLTRLQLLIREHGFSDQYNTIELRRFDTPYADIRVFLTEETGAKHSDRASLLTALEQLPEVASVKPKKSTISVRLSDEFIRSVGGELELGNAPVIDIPAAIAARQYLIGFLGPDTSKALHLGHLRNMIIGNALASAFVSAGASSASYSLVGDIGRSMCEAMAGFQLFHQDVDLRQAGIKPDHFVGRCYRDYLEHNPHATGADDGDPCAREHIPTTDLADNLLLRWRSEDPLTKSLWQNLNEMVALGHNETVENLGIVIDRCYYESEHIQHAVDLIQRGLKQGILERLDDGMVVYHTGREEFRKIILQRSDGFPTEHGRVLAVFQQVFADHEMGVVHIDWNGTEWEPAQTVLKELMSALGLIPANSLHLPVFHGMVMLKGEKMSSSINQEPIYVDDLLNQVWQSREVASLAETTRGQIDHRAIADIVIKGFFLCEPLSKHVSYSWDRLMDSAVNKGWLIAQAWCRANSPAANMATDAAVPDQVYRLAVVQSQGFQRALTNTISKFQPESLTRFLIHFCTSYLGGIPTRSLNSLALTVLRMTLDSLGFCPVSNCRESVQRNDKHLATSAGLLNDRSCASVGNSGNESSGHSY